jgi:uncharacterized protein YndB with AHSA1/START domain
MSLRRGSVRHAIRLDCPPDVVWELVGDPTRLAEWFPGVASCVVEGTSRTIVTGSGIPMPEEILTVDNSNHRFQYRVTSPLFEEHLGTIDVHDLGDSSSYVVYSTDAAPAVMALIIGGAARAGLHSLPGLLGLTESRENTLAT